MSSGLWSGWYLIDLAFLMGNLRLSRLTSTSAESLSETYSAQSCPCAMAKVPGGEPVETTTSNPGCARIESEQRAGLLSSLYLHAAAKADELEGVSNHGKIFDNISR